MSRLVIRGGRVIDPLGGMDGLYNIYCMSGRIAAIKEAGSDRSSIDPQSPDIACIDAEGLVVVPGLVDLHTHLREPGHEYKETIESGCMAAARGGFTTILCMPNTSPVNDNESVTRYILSKAEHTGVNVRPVGAITHGLKGERFTDMAELKAAGCVALSDDGRPVVDSRLFRRALEYARGTGLPVISHSEDVGLSANGVMNEGAVATRLGLQGIPNAAEDIAIARDISIAELTGASLHIAHVSTRGGVELIRRAKERGIARITAEATPHHLTLTEEDVVGYNTNAKMNPPLRTLDDCLALRQGIRDGTIDCIATDHAPQSIIEKDTEFDKAANGVIGLETAFSVIYGLVEQGAFGLMDAVRCMTLNPAKAIGIDAGSISVGSVADIAVIDLSRSYVLRQETLASRSKNSPYIGRGLKGVILKTISAGNVIFERKGEG
jgi:dihydroorotase